MSALRLIPPVFAPRPVEPNSEEQAALDVLGPFVRAGVLASLDLHVAALLGRRVGMLDPDVLLAAALAVRAPRFGHICVDLDALTIGELLPAAVDGAADDAPAPPNLPESGWADRVRRADALVRDAADVERLTPFVLDGSTLYTDRYWSYQGELGAQVRRWSGGDGLLSVAADDVGALDEGLRELFRPPQIEDDEPGTLNLQRVAGALALTRRYAVITGGPGMGKTWTVRNLLALLWIRHQRRIARGETDSAQLSVALAAPTGKAAARMREALRDRMTLEFLPALERFLPQDRVEELGTFVQDLEARTLHRLLGYRHDSPSRFRHDRRNPLPYDAVIVDEASMVDFPLMAKLADAIGDQGPAGEPTRLILLGDRHQLASVEAGTVLADLCGPTRADELRFTPAALAELERFESLAGLETRQDGGKRTRVVAVDGPAAHDAVVQFNRTFRFDESGGIGAFAAACLLPEERFSAQAVVDGLAASGSRRDRGETALLEYGKEGALPADLAKLLVDGYRPYLSLLKRGWREPTAEHPTLEVFHRRVLQAFDRFRVLCAHRRGRTGVRGLNELTQALLRKAELIRPSGTWWTGRPILVLRNDYTVRRSGGGRGLFNGDIGLLVHRVQDGVRHRAVVFPGVDGLPATGGPGQPPALAEEHYRDRKIVEYVEPNRLPEHATVFAMTIHKSQGSEFDDVLVVTPSNPSQILTRELIYTGVTRARERVTVLCDRKVLTDSLNETVRRASGLEGVVW